MSVKGFPLNPRVFPLPTPEPFVFGWPEAKARMETVNQKGGLLKGLGFPDSLQALSSRTLVVWVSEADECSVFVPQILG